MEGFKKIAQEASDKRSTIFKSALLAGAMLMHPGESSEQQHHKKEKPRTEQSVKTTFDTTSTLAAHDSLKKEIDAAYFDKVEPAPAKLLITEHIPYSPKPIPEKIIESLDKKIETKKAENPPVLMGVNEFRKSFEDMIVTSMREKGDESKLYNIEMNKEGDHLAFKATVVSPVDMKVYKTTVDVKISGTIIQDGDRLIIPKETREIDAGRLLTAKAKVSVNPHLDNAIEKYMTRKNIKSMKIVPGGVQIQYK
jgi:hypothetical protein